MQTFTKEFILENGGCYLAEQLQQLISDHGDKPITLMDIVSNENIPLKDRYWFLCKKVNNKQQNQQLAIEVAEIVLPIYEKIYPGDNRVREAIEADKQYLAGHISLGTLIEKRRAAYAAYAADAAYAAAYAAAYSAYAADADAADAAYAAAYAAYAADIKQQLENLLLEKAKQF